MKLKIVIIFLCAFITTGYISAQEVNNVQYPEMKKNSARKKFPIPDIPGYKTLKCDFHIHTVFSDGIVWPEYRVEEAWQEGLDAIAITDHIENQPSKKYISGDHNSSYEIAYPVAEEKDIILIRGGEITRQMPPGHLNALFLEDVNKLDVPIALNALKEAKKQGAFIIWNHPGWKAQQPDTCRWMPMHQHLYEQGLINGIEVFNEVEYYPIVLDWCIEKKIPVIGNSDIHGIVSNTYDIERSYRPVTLVFAKERSKESIKEALFAGRTLALFNNKMAGREDLLTEIFRASVTIKRTGSNNGKKIVLYEITNNSIIDYQLETNKGDLFVISAESTILRSMNPSHYENIRITNLYTGSGNCLTLNSLF